MQCLTVSFWDKSQLFRRLRWLWELWCWTTCCFLLGVVGWCWLPPSFSLPCGFVPRQRRSCEDEILGAIQGGFTDVPDICSTTKLVDYINTPWNKKPKEHQKTTTTNTPQPANHKRKPTIKRHHGLISKFPPSIFFADLKVLTAPRSPKVGVVVGNVEVWRFWGWSKSQQGTQPRCVRVELRNWKILIEVWNLWEVGGPSDWVIFEKIFHTPPKIMKNARWKFLRWGVGLKLSFFKGGWFSFMFAGGGMGFYFETNKN